MQGENGTQLRVAVDRPNREMKRSGVSLGTYQCWGKHARMGIRD